MGFDLYASTGAYFRASFDEWPRLWALVERTCGDFLTREDIEGGKVNDGYQITASRAERIADRLAEVLASEAWRREALEGATAQNADITAQQSILEHLKRRGYRSVRLENPVKQSDGFTEYTLVPEEIRIPEDAGQYSFAWQRVREFADFCRVSGGFAIH